MCAKPTVALDALQEIGPVSCLTCNKVTPEHLKSLAYIANKPVYKDLLSVLCITLPEDVSGIYICDTCMKTVQKVVKMRQTCQNNMALVEHLKDQIQSTGRPVLRLKKKAKKIRILEVKKGGILHKFNTDGTVTSTSLCRDSQRLADDSPVLKKAKLIPNMIEEESCKEEGMGEVNQGTGSERVTDDPSLEMPNKEKGSNMTTGENSQNNLCDAEALTFDTTPSTSGSMTNASIGSGEMKLEHNYACEIGKERALSVPEMYDLHRRNILQECKFNESDETAIRSLCVKDLCINDFLRLLANIPAVQKFFWQYFLIIINYELEQLCSHQDRSLLLRKLQDIDHSTFMDELTRELHKRCPKVFDFLLTMSTPMYIQVSGDSRTIAAIYGIAMYSRNAQMTAFPKMIAETCLKHNAGKKLLKILNKMSISTIPKGKFRSKDALSRSKAIAKSTLEDSSGVLVIRNRAQEQFPVTAIMLNRAKGYASIDGVKQENFSVAEVMINTAQKSSSGAGVTANREEVNTIDAGNTSNIAEDDDSDPGDLMNITLDPYTGILTNGTGESLSDAGVLTNRIGESSPGGTGETLSDAGVLTNRTDEASSGTEVLTNRTGESTLGDRLIPSTGMKRALGVVTKSRKMQLCGLKLPTVYDELTVNYCNNQLIMVEKVDRKKAHNKGKVKEKIHVI